MMGYFKYCSKCENKIPPKMGYHGMKPDKARKWKYICSGCEKVLGGYHPTQDFLKGKFREEGYKHEI